MRLILSLSVVLNVSLLVLLLNHDGGPVSTESPVTIAESVSISESLTEDRVGSRFEPLNAFQDTIPSPYRLALKVTPALPGLVGYEFQELARQVHPAEALAAEAEDPGWAADMESRILAGDYESNQEPYEQILVECRMTLCGVVIELSAGGDLQNAMRAINDYMTGNLGFGRIDTIGQNDSDRKWLVGYFKAER